MLWWANLGPKGVCSGSYTIERRDGGCSSLMDVGDGKLGDALVGLISDVAAIGDGPHS